MTEAEAVKLVRDEIRTVVGNYHEKSMFGAMEGALVKILLAASRPGEGMIRTHEGEDLRIDPSRSWDTGYNRVFTVPSASAAKGVRDGAFAGQGGAE